MQGDEHGGIIARVHGLPFNANVKLLLAAPELLEALQGYIKAVQRYVGNDAPSPWLIDAEEKALEAIDKATK